MKLILFIILLATTLCVFGQDGKVFVKSDPAGASIFAVDASGAKTDTGKKTAALLELPVGRQTLELSLPGFKPASVAVDVDSKAISKPEAVVLEPVTVPVDVVFEEGFAVFADGKPALGADGKQPTTPCTVMLTLGAHGLVLAKEGFQ